MKRITFTLITIFLIIILSTSIFAQTQVNDYNNYGSLTMSLNIDTEFELVKTGSSARASEVNSYLTFIPREDNLQKINNINSYSTPNAEIKKDQGEYTYTWNNPSYGIFNFGIDSEIETGNVLVVIDEKIHFPLDDITGTYLSPTEFIDLNTDIRQQAEEIAEGEDDLYIVSFKIAQWINKNIEYDLSTLTADVVQKSSWVLENKQGVCDEITNLFISMMRSLGVSARFVTGMAYTNLNNQWGPHGWAEVYFPDKGWVPFDVTYGQFGWIDPTHIKLKVSADSGEAALRYTWRAADTNIEGKEIDISVNLIEKGQKISSPLEFTIRPLVDNVGPNSYVPIELEIKNNNEYYIPDSFLVTKATNLTESNLKAALLKPGETKKIFWITNIPSDVQEGYIYVSNIEVEDQFHTTAETQITYGKNLRKISLEQAQELVRENANHIEQRTVSKVLGLICVAPRTAYIYEELKAECKVKNKGNIRLNEVSVCHEENCQTFDLSIAEEKDIEFPLNLNQGVDTIIIDASNADTRTSEILTISVLENPGLNISDIDYPQIVSYKDGFNIILTLTTLAEVKDLKIKINNQEITEIDNLLTAKEIIIQTTGKDMYNGEEIKLDLEFKDVNDHEYPLSSSYPLTITEVPWYIKFFNWLGLI